MHGVEPSCCLRQGLTGICPTTCSALGACGSRWSPVQKQWSKSSDVCLQELHWPTLSSRRNYLSVTMMYDILHGQYDSLKLSDYCKFNTSCTRAHSMILVPPQSTINSYRFSFFVNTAFLWNTVPYDSYSISQCTKVSTSAIPSFLSCLIFLFVISCNLFLFCNLFFLLCLLYPLC